ncbi:hypothetical protein [Humisphaera borealis]|uniref:Uncharacterized protein n=1 Tax=Humisphaera borealis TaxID=2807512 RepID=A0A7M2WZG8_9BACT|nr:hypothetical protein [Humisphaera borealis]QOV90251.1 hypothetical protein IPV69_02430 [Humisphaera borealis]
MNRSGLFVVALMLLVIGALSMKVVSQDAAPATPAAGPATLPADAISALTPLRGIDVAVRNTGEANFTEKTKRVPVEAFRDEDFGTLTYISGNGSIAALPQPANFELRQLPFDRFYETVRFSPIAGVAWRLNLRTAKWQLIEEAGPLLPGTYDIDMFHVSDSTMVVMRIDKLTGRTWTMVSAEGKPDKWNEIAEPDAPKADAAK